MPSSLPAAPRIAPYKRYLTSIWHTRWLRAAAVALLWHLSISAVLGDWYSSVSSLFWTINPIGAAGLKAALFWITSLIIFMIPLSTFKIGRRCMPSKWATIKILFMNPIVPATIFLWHIVSAFWFCQVFVYFSPPSQNLAWIINGGYGSPDRLNERPLYLFAFLEVLSLAHAIWYIVEDKSTMSVHTKPFKGQDTKNENETALARIIEQAPAMAMISAAFSLACSAVTTIIYSVVFRQPLWRFTMIFARAFANMARSDGQPPNNFYFGGVILKAFFVGFLLSMTWQIDNLLFEVFMVTAPVKNGLPLSASSKDPNGTLLNGLTRKSDLIKAFAFWELFIISESHPLRRKEIFADIERPGSAPMSALMVNAGLDVINSIELRIAQLGTQTGKPNDHSTPGAANAEVQHLPRLLPNAVPAKNPILIPSNPTTSTSGLDRVGSYISHEARVLGSSSSPWSPPLQKGKQLAIEYSSPAAQQIRSRAEEAQQSWIGRYLITTPAQLVDSIVLGTPTGNATLHLHAIQSVTNLLVASLSEDTYGKAVSSVPPAIQAMTRSIFNIENIMSKHTDGTVTQTDLQEVLGIHACLKSCLKSLLERFGSFLRDVGLSIRDLNEAQKAAEDRSLSEILHIASQTTREQPKQREMEDARPNRQRVNGSQKAANADIPENSRRRSGEVKAGKRRADADRPGRLFPQLDEGSAIDKAWRERRNSGKSKG